MGITIVECAQQRHAEGGLHGVAAFPPPMLRSSTSKLRTELGGMVLPAPRSAIAMNGAFLVNAAILIVAAAVFWSNQIPVTEIQQAYQLLEGKEVQNTVWNWVGSFWNRCWPVRSAAHSR